MASACGSVPYYLPWEQDSVGYSGQWDLYRTVGSAVPRRSLTLQGPLCVSLVVENEPLGKLVPLSNWCPNGWSVSLEEPSIHCSVKSDL